MKLQNSILNSSPLLRRGARGEAAFLLVTLFALAACTSSKTENKQPTFTLTKTDKFLFNSFVDCNMAEVWVGDTFRIFPGKYGEDTLWGYSDNLRFGNGANADEAFANKFEDLIMPDMPKNVKPTEDGYTEPFGLKLFIRIRKMLPAKHCMPFITTKTIHRIFLTTNKPARLHL
jgi:hypothetical protein